MSGESVNNSAELTLGINTKPAETAIGKLQTKLKGLVENLDKLNKAAGVQHVVSPEAAKEIGHLTQQVKILQAEVEALKAKGESTGKKLEGDFARIPVSISGVSKAFSVADKDLGKFGGSAKTIADQLKTLASIGIDLGSTVNGQKLLQMEAAGTSKSLTALVSKLEVLKAAQRALGKVDSKELFDHKFGAGVSGLIDKLDTLKEKLSGIQASEKAFKDQQKSMGSLYKETKTLASGYTTLGQKVKGAAELVKKFGLEATEGFLGKSGDGFLVKLIPQLDQLKSSAQSQYTISKAVRESEWNRLKDQANIGRSIKDQTEALQKQLALVRKINDEKKAGATVASLGQKYGANATRAALYGDKYSEESIANQISHLEALAEDKVRFAQKDKQLDDSIRKQSRRLLTQHYANVEREQAQHLRHMEEGKTWAALSEQKRLQATLVAAQALAAGRNPSYLRGLAGSSFATQDAISLGSVNEIQLALDHEKALLMEGAQMRRKFSAERNADDVHANSISRKLLRDHNRNMALERRWAAEEAAWAAETSEKKRLQAIHRAALANAAYDPKKGSANSSTLSGLAGNSIAAQLASEMGGVSGVEAKLEALDKLTKATKEQTKSQDADTRSNVSATKRARELAAAWASLDEESRLRIAKRTATNIANGGDPTNLRGLAGSALAIDYVREKNGLDGVKASLLSLQTAAKNWDLSSVNLFGGIQDSFVNSNRERKEQLNLGNQIVAMTRRERKEQEDYAAAAARISERSIAARVKDEQWKSLARQSFSADEKEQVSALNKRLGIVKSINEEYRAGASLRSISEKYGSAAVRDVAGQKYEGSRVFGLTEDDLKAEISQVKQAGIARAAAKEAARKAEAQADAAYLRDARAKIADHYASERALLSQKEADDKASLARAIKERVMQMDIAHNKELRAERVQAAALANARYNSTYGGDQKRALTNQRTIIQGITTSVQAGVSPGEIVGKYGPDAYRDFIQGKVKVEDLNRSLANLSKSHKELKPATDGSRDSMVHWNKIGHESHSLARGLAGSMNALWLTWGSTVPLLAGAAISGSLRGVVQSGKDVEYQLRFVQELSGSAAVSISELSKAMEGTLQTPKQAAEGMRALAQAGLDTKQALEALPTILNLATVGELSMKDAALGATGVMHAFGLEVADLAHIGDVFAKSAAISNTSVEGMVGAMKYASTVAEVYNVSLEEVSAALTVMAKRNIESTSAGTALRNMMNEFAAPTDKARGVMEKLGFSAFDTNKKLKDLPTLLEDLKYSLAGLSEQSQIEALNKLFGERGGKAIAALIKDTGEFTKVLRTLREETDGFTSSVAAGLGDTVEGQFKRAAAEIQKSFTSVFMDTNDGIKALTASIADLFASDGFRDFLRGIVEGFMTVIQLTKEWADELKFLALGFVAFKAGELAFAGLALAAGKAASGIALLSGIGSTIDAARIALAATAKGIQGVEIVGSPVITKMVQGFGSFAFAVGGIVPAMALAGGAVAALGVAVALAAKDWWDMAEARAKDEAAMKSWQVTSNSILGSLNRESEELTKNISKIRERNQAILEGRSLDTGSEAQPSGVAKLAQGIESQIANMKAKGGFKYVDGTWGGVSQEDLSELARREADYLKAAATDAGNATKRGVQREENDRARVVAEFDRLRDSVASAYRKKQTPEALSILTELSRSTDLPTADLRQLVSRLSSKADGSVLSTVNFGKDSKSSAAANDARRAEIATTQGWLRELSQLEKQAQDELATSYNDGIVSASEYWEGRLELANSYTALEISAIDNLIANQKDLTKTELAQLTAKKKLLEGQLDGGNAADNARKQSDAQAKLKRSYDQIVAAAEKQIALYRNDTVYESLARQTDEFGRQRLEIDRTVEAFKLSEIAKVEALNVANKQNKDLTEAQLAGINRLTEAERQALEERLALNRAYEGNWVNGATEAWKAWKDSANNAAKITKESFTRVFQKVDEVFLDFIRTGKLNFKSLGQTIKDEVIKLLYELTVKDFVIGITGDFSNLALALGGTALKSILGVSGGGGSTSGGGTNYTGLASNASTAYSLYGGAKAAYAAYQGTAAGLSASETGAATWAYLQSGDFGTALGVALKGALGTEASTATTAASLEAYYAAQGLEASTMGVATEAGLGGAAGLSWASALFAIPFIAKFFNDRSRPLPLEFTGLAVDGQYNGKTFDGSLATNYMQGGSYWDQRMPLTSDAAIVAQNYQNLKPPVIEIANPAYADWQRAYQEAGFQNQVGSDVYLNGEERVVAPSRVSGYDEGYTPAPYSTDPAILGNIDAAIEAAFNAPKSAMKKVAELFGDAELATQIDAFTAKISVSGRNIGEILGKIGAQVTTDLGQAFLPSIEAARVQGAALRTGLETAIANATTAGDTEAVNTLKAQMEALGVAAGETWNQTFERVLKETDAVSKAMDLLGVSLKDIGDANKVLTLSDNLVTLFGSIDALNTSINAYYGNFYTEAEKQERAWKGMGDTFKSLNLALPKTREEFRALVDAQDLTTAAGQQTFAALMNVQGAFADLVPAVAAVAAETVNLKDSLTDMVAGLKTAVEDALSNVTAAYDRDVDNVNSSYEATMKPVQAAIDAAQKIYDDIAKDVQAKREAAQRELDLVMRDVASMLKPINAQISSYNAKIAAENTRYNAEMKTLADERKAATKAYNDAIKGLPDAIDKLRSAVDKVKALRDSLTGTLDGLRIQGSEAAYRTDAQAQIRNALAIARSTGNLPDAEALSSALSTISQPSEDLFATFEDYARDFYRTAIDIRDLSDIAGDQLSVTEPQLAALEAMKATLETNYAAQTAAFDAQQETLSGIHDTLLKSLESQLKFWEDLKKALDDKATAAQDKFNGITTGLDEELYLAAQALKEALTPLTVQKDDLEKDWAAELAALKATYDEALATYRDALRIDENIGTLAGNIAILATAIAAYQAGTGDKGTTTNPTPTNQWLTSPNGTQSYLDPLGASALRPTGGDASATLVSGKDGNTDTLQYLIDAANALATSGAYDKLIADAANKGIGADNVANILNNGTGTTITGADVTNWGADTVAGYAKADIKTWVLDRLTAGDRQGIYARALAEGISSYTLDGIMGWAQGTALDWAKSNGFPAFAQGTNFVPNDMIAQIHQGERIIPAADNTMLMTMLNNGDRREEVLVEEIKALRAEVKQLREENMAAQTSIATNTRKSAQVLDEFNEIGMPGVRE